RPKEGSAAPQSGPADVLEKELLQVLLAEPRLVPVAVSQVSVTELAHSGLKKLLQGLYDLHARGEPAELDQLRPLIANPSLIETAMTFQEVGRMNKNPAAWLDKVLAAFSQRRLKPKQQELQNQLQAVGDHTEAVELLRQLQVRTVSSQTGTAS